jgi:long-subunit fatty acid transport protein
MKKSLLALIFAVALAVPAMAENMWVGGYFSYSSDNNKVEYPGGEDTVSSTSWSIAPEFGYSLNEKWDIGLDLAYASKQGLDGAFGEDWNAPFTLDNTEKVIAPFARYHIAQIAGIDVMLKGSIFYATGEYSYVYSSKYTFDYTTYGLKVAPIVSYSINETWSIGATLNFAELSFVHTESDDYDDYKSDKFGFNLNDGSLISIGFSYHF